MKIKLKANAVGQFYFPKIIREQWGHNLELRPNLRTGVLYPIGTPASDVLKSLQAVMIELRQEAEREEAKENEG